MRFVYTPFGAPPAYDSAVAVGCDGLPPAKVCLSHWPGNTTPADLKHDLSTGVALAFARLGASRALERFGPLSIVTNDHFDTDGLLAVFACLNPAAALEIEDSLLAAARAGDFWCAPSRQAAAFDIAVTASTDPDRSPWAAEAGDATGRERIAYERLLAALPGALAHPESLPMDITDELRRLDAGMEHLLSDAVVKQWRPDLDLCILQTQMPVDPRAIFEIAKTDRVLLLESIGKETLVSLQFTTASWFDGIRERTLPRVDLAELADRLQQNHGSSSRWIATPGDAPFASLAFGASRESGVRDQHVTRQPVPGDPGVVVRIILQFLESRMQQVRPS